MPGRLLIADKVASNRVVLRMRLEAARYDTELVGDTAELVAALDRAPADLLLVDASLVETDLAAGLTRIRRAPGARHLPIIVTTGQDTRLTVADVLEAGGDDLQRRPVDGQLLMARVRSLLRARETFEEAARRRVTAQHMGFSEPSSGFRGAPRLALVAPPDRPPHPVEALLPRRTRRLEPRDALDLSDAGTAPELLLLALSDGEDGLPLLSELRARHATRYAAIIALVPDGAARLAVDALDRGANDVAGVDATAQEIALRLDRQLELKRVAEQLRRSIDDGYVAATLDPLTGIYNRRYADFHLGQLHDETAAGGQGYAVILADLDHFKQVNDRHGHPAGDTVLTAFAQRMRSALRNPDLLARYGGEEFLAVLPKTGRDEAQIVAERLANVTRSIPVTLPRGEELWLTASFGVAAVPPFGRPGDVLDRADAALYRAKAAGRDRVAMAPDLPPPPGTALETG